MSVSVEYAHGMGAAAAFGLPAISLSLPPQIFESTPERMHPVRDWDFLALQDFFDHSGNILNGVWLAFVPIWACGHIEKRVSEKWKVPFLLGVGALGSAASFAVNMAYEAGAYIPPFPQKAAEAPFDVADAMYGGVGGTALSLIFCGAAIHKKLKDRKLERQRQAQERMAKELLRLPPGIWDN